MVPLKRSAEGEAGILGGGYETGQGLFSEPVCSLTTDSSMAWGLRAGWLPQPAELSAPDDILCLFPAVDAARAEMMLMYCNPGSMIAQGALKQTSPDLDTSHKFTNCIYPRVEQKLSG